MEVFVSSNSIIFQAQEVANSNILGRSYHNIVKNKLKVLKKYISFVNVAKNNPGIIVEHLPDEMAEKFLADIKLITLPENYEEFVQDKYKKMIFHIINKVFKSLRLNGLQLDEDELFVEGQIALRKALWNYNKPEIKFITVAYTYVFRSLTDYRKNQIKKANGNREKTNLFNQEDSLSKKFFMDAVSLKKYVADKHHTDSTEISLNKILLMSCRNDFDNEIVKIWIQNKSVSEVNWVEIAQNAYFAAYNKTITANGIRERFVRIRERCSDYIKNNKINMSDIHID